MQQVNQQYTLTKLVWLIKHEPEAYAKFDKILSAKTMSATG
jgi:sugar (pentulose or hexulose) kinase